MAAFSLRLDLAIKVNRHFLATSMVTYHFFFCGFELGNKLLSMYNKNNRRKRELASNRDYNHGAIIRIYWV